MLFITCVLICNVFKIMWLEVIYCGGVNPLTYKVKYQTGPIQNHPIANRKPGLALSLRTDSSCLATQPKFNNSWLSHTSSSIILLTAWLYSVVILKSLFDFLVIRLIIFLVGTFPADEFVFFLSEALFSRKDWSQFNFFGLLVVSLLQQLSRELQCCLRLWC